MELIRLLLRNTLRHKLRSLLTILGIGVAVMAFVLLRTVVTAWHAGVEASTANRLITRHAVSFVFPLPLSYRDRIAQVPGVDKVTYATWFSGVYIDKKQFFARLAVDSETFFDVYPEFVIEKDQFEVFKREGNAAIIGTDIAERYNLKLGDVMPMTPASLIAKRAMCLCCPHAMTAWVVGDEPGVVVDFQEMIDYAKSV
jgi:putative ABC transport system permease protein